MPVSEAPTLTDQVGSTSLRSARVRRAPLPGGGGQPQSVDGGKVDTKNPDRGPLLIISGEKDNTDPWSIANATRIRKAFRE
jgi:hypothetical protein